MDEPRKTSPLQAAQCWLKHLVFPKNEGSLKDVLEEVIEEHEENGEEALAPQERVMLQNVLSFGDRTVSDIMIPRTDIVAVPHDIAFDELKTHIIEQRHTRTPVYEGTLDHLLGFLHVKDLLPMMAGDKPYEIHSYLRTLLYVPPSMKVLDLLAKMRSVGSHMAIVADEHGGTDGLVTMEDVVEEIVGEIQDEHDEDEAGDSCIIRIGEKMVEVSARIHIEQLEKRLGLQFAGEDVEQEFDTLAGLISTQLGRLPAKGEIVPHSSGVKFEIIDADPRRIRKVRVHLA